MAVGRAAGSFGLCDDGRVYAEGEQQLEVPAWRDHWWSDSVGEKYSDEDKGFALLKVGDEEETWYPLAHYQWEDNDRPPPRDKALVRLLDSVQSAM